MKWTPFLSAVTAVAYIAGVALFLQFIQSVRQDTPDTIFDGMGFISLFVFSAAIMAFLFFYQPLVRLVDNKKSEALFYFLKTILIFGLITTGVLALTILQ